MGKQLMAEDPVQRGETWLTSLLKLADLPASVQGESAETHEDGSCWLTIDSASYTSEQIQMLTGESGSVLDAVQYLINTTLNLGLSPDEQQPYTIELDGYRLRRQTELRSMAEAAAQKVRDNGEEFEMGALSSAERRQVHTFLKAFEDLETYSRGQEPDRRLVVKPKG